MMYFPNFELLPSNCTYRNDTEIQKNIKKSNASRLALLVSKTFDFILHNCKLNSPKTNRLLKLPRMIIYTLSHGRVQHFLFVHRWTLTPCALKAPGRPASTRGWHPTPSWRVVCYTPCGPSTRTMTARRAATWWCMPTIPTMPVRSLSTSLSPTRISIFPLWTTTLETTSFMSGTTIMCCATHWSLDHQTPPRVRSDPTKTQCVWSSKEACGTHISFWGTSVFNL